MSVGRLNCRVVKFWGQQGESEDAFYEKHLTTARGPVAGKGEALNNMGPNFFNCFVCGPFLVKHHLVRAHRWTMIR